MAGRKLYPYYVTLYLADKDTQGKSRKRTTKLNASSPTRAIYNASMMAYKDYKLENVIRITVEEYDEAHQPEMLDKDDVYICVTTIDDKYFECRITGKQLTVEGYKALPDKILKPRKNN